MASSLRNMARRHVPKAPEAAEPESPSVSEIVVPVTEEVEALVAPPEAGDVSDGHVVHPETDGEGPTGGVANEEVVKTESDPEPAVEKAAPVEEVKVATSSKKKKKTQRVSAPGAISTDEKKEAETK